MDKPRGRDRLALLDPNNQPPGYPLVRLRPTVYNEIWELAANNVIMAAENTRNCIDGAELIVGVPVTEYDPLMECGHVSPVPRDNPPADGSRDGRAQWRHMAVRVCEDTTALQCHL